MSKFILAGTFAVFALFIGCSEPVKEDEPPQSPVQHHDKDRNGQLSEEERLSMNEKFVEKFDQDGDGELSAQERRVAREQSQVRVSAVSNELNAAENAANLIRRMDTDEDGAVSKEEAGEKRWQALSRADINQDEKVTTEEWQNRNR